MLQLSLAGNLGRNAEYRTTQGGDGLCSFSVATEIGFGERKQTVWVDVTRWGKGAESLSKILRKGSKVAVTGEMSLREHEGKTYVQCRADRVTIQGTPNEAPAGGSSDPAHGGWDSDPDDPNAAPF
jgi:single-strand DNA-binding protein